MFDFNFIDVIIERIIDYVRRVYSSLLDFKLRTPQSIFQTKFHKNDIFFHD